MRRLLLSLWAVVLFAALPGCQQAPRIQKIQNYAEGTTYHISWWSDKPVDEEALRRQIGGVLAQIDKEISNYRNDSDIEVFNRAHTTAWQPLPPDVVNLLAIARRVYLRSGGCYDPTIEPLFALWGFAADKLHVPSARQIATAERAVGFDKVQLDVPGHRVRKTVPQLAINMSSLGEGYSIWRLARVLESKGIHNYIVEFGGDLLVKGHKPEGQKWRIAIARPVPGQLAVQKVITIENEHGVSINTSGTYRRFFDDKGKIYPHILDPRTGAPVHHNLVSATVFDTDPRVSDAWATAMLCLGKRQGDAVAERDGIRVFFVQQEGKHLIESESTALRRDRGVKIE